MLPALYHYDSYTIWKINIKKIFSSDCFIKFIVKYEHEVSIINKNIYFTCSMLINLINVINLRFSIVNLR